MSSTTQQTQKAINDPDKAYRKKEIVASRTVINAITPEGGIVSRFNKRDDSLLCSLQISGCSIFSDEMKYNFFKLSMGCEM